MPSKNNEILWLWVPAQGRDDGRYFIAPKRLSNEFDETIGAEPATWAGAAAGAGKCPGPVLVLSARPAGELAMGYGWRPDPGAPVAQERGP